MIYAAKAREDGYEQNGNIFEETGGNEREHAEIINSNFVLESCDLSS